MDLVGTALGEQTYLCAGRSPSIGIAIGRRHAEFFGRVEGGAQHTGKRETIGLVVVVQTVQSYVALIGTGAGNRSAAAVGILVDHPPQIEHPWLKTEQVGNISSFHREGFDGLVID